MMRLAIFSLTHHRRSASAAREAIREALRAKKRATAAQAPALSLTLRVARSLSKHISTQTERWLGNGRSAPSRWASTVVCATRVDPERALDRVGRDVPVARERRRLGARGRTAAARDHGNRAPEQERDDPQHQRLGAVAHLCRGHGRLDQRRVGLGDAHRDELARRVRERREQEPRCGLLRQQRRHGQVHQAQLHPTLLLRPSLAGAFYRSLSVAV